MTADILNDLAARVEALEGADRLLSLRIICALDIRPAWLRNCTGHLWLDTVCPNPVVRWCDERMKQSSGNPSVEDGPEFTASTDAAMSLVPEGAWWWVEAQPLVKGRFLAGCADERISTAATPALALTAACLRAIAEMGKDNG